MAIILDFESDPERIILSLDSIARIEGFPRLTLRDSATGRFLGKRGWVKSETYLHAGVLSSEAPVRLSLPRDMAAFIISGTRVEVEDTKSKQKDTFTWERRAVEKSESPAEVGFKDDGASAHVEPPRKDVIIPRFRNLGRIALVFVLGVSIGAGVSYFGIQSQFARDQRLADDKLHASQTALESALIKVKADRDSDKSKADSLERRTTQLNQKVTELRARIADLQADRQAFDKRLEDARVASQTDANAVLSAQISVLKSERDSSDARAKALEASLEKAGEDLAAKDTDISKIKSDFDATKSALATAQQSASDRDDRISTITAEKNDLKQRSEAVEARLTTAEKLLEERNSEVSQLRAQNVELLNQPAVDTPNNQLSSGQSAQNSVPPLNGGQSVADYRRQLADRDAEIDALMAELQKSSPQSGKNSTANVEHQAKIGTLESQIQRQDTQIALVTDERNRAQATISELLGQLRTITSSRDDLSQQQKVQEQALNACQFDRDANAGNLQTINDLQQKLDNARNMASSNACNVRTIWGAAAIGNNGVVYTIQSQVDEKGAVNVAMAVCQGKTGRKCRLITSYSNACFAVARIGDQGARPDNWNFGLGQNWQAAEETAIARCQSNSGQFCTARFTSCAPDQLSKPE